MERLENAILRIDVRKTEKVIERKLPNVYMGKQCTKLVLYCSHCSRYFIYFNSRMAYEKIRGHPVVYTYSKATIRNDL